MSKPNQKAMYAGYGLHYHANNQLFPNVSDRMLFQCLLDIVRKQLASSLDNQTIILSQRQLGRMAGLNIYRTIPSSLERLEALGLIKKHKNGISIMCDQYVALLQYYESLNNAEREKFAEDFTKIGIRVLEKNGIVAKVQCRSELLGVSGSSILVSQCCRSAAFSESEAKNVAEVQHFQNEDHKMLQKCNIPMEAFNVAEVQHFAEAIAETLHLCNTYCTFAELIKDFPAALLQHEAIDAIKIAFETGFFPKDSIFGPEKCCTSATLSVALLQLLASKMLHFCSTVIIYNNKIYNKRDEQQKNEVIEDSDEDYSRDIQKGFEGFGKVEVIDFDKPSEDIKEDSEEIEELSQQNLKRAERSMRARNSYRNKPFIKVERVKEIVDCLDEVVKSPVDFFLYQFWWGIFDLYCDHYHPSSRIDEEGEVEEEPQSTDWKEMIGAALPQDEIYSLAQNIYEDMVGAVEQGKYVYGDSNEWEVKFGFKTFQDFNPYEIFQWTPCTMQDKSVPALRVAIDRFYDIEANDVFTASRGDKKTKSSQNKKLISLILSANDSSLSPMEIAIKTFYRDFVISGEENVIDEFTDGRGTALESGGGLPDHLLKPWCYNLSSVGYNEFTGVLCSKYKPCDGVHKKAYIFSAENVVEWNERNSYTDTIAHQALQ